MEATGADDALNAIGTVDIALIDFNMLGLDEASNWSLLGFAKTAPEMPVAIVSANLQDEIIARARELKAAFIAKPLTDEALGAFLSGATLRLKKAKQ